MTLPKPRSEPSTLHYLAAFSLVLLLTLCVLRASAQSTGETLLAPSLSNKSDAATGVGNTKGGAFRVEKVPVAGGAEIITIFARYQQQDVAMQGPVVEMPLVSILRDTLGDESPENDRLRYVWKLSY